MKFGSIVVDGREIVIVQTGKHQAVPMASLYSLAGLGDAPATMQALIGAANDELERARLALHDSVNRLTPLLDTRTLNWLP